MLSRPRRRRRRRRRKQKLFLFFFFFFRCFVCIFCVVLFQRKFFMYFYLLFCFSSSSPFICIMITSHRASTRNSLQLSLLSLILITVTTLNLVRASADAHRRDDLSFRGPVPEDLRIPHWDLSGSALVHPK